MHTVELFTSLNMFDPDSRVTVELDLCTTWVGESSRTDYNHDHHREKERSCLNHWASKSSFLKVNSYNTEDFYDSSFIAAGVFYGRYRTVN